MSRAGQRVLSMLLWSWGGTVYFLLEVAFKSATHEPERISWTMLVLAMLLRPKHFPLWYVVQLVKGISVLAILLSLISLIGCKYGVIVENDDIMNAVRLWPEGRGVCLVLLCAGLLLSVGSICAARPVQRVGEYFGIAKK